MKRILFLSILLFGMASSYAQYTLEDQIYDYIDEYKDLAMSEMEQYKVPASITLAQAIYASKCGTNRIAKEANNHFGIMCHTKEWTGPTFYETENHSSEYCFRKYATVEESYRDHSLFLSQRSRYIRLFYLPITDYKSWANGLKEAGYSGNPHYADTLISIIEKYYLMHYDRKVAQRMGDTSALASAAIPKTSPITSNSASQSPVTKPVEKAEPKPAQPETVATVPVKPVETQPAKPVQTELVETKPSKPETKSEPAAKPKADTMEVNGIQVIVNKSEKPKQPKMDTIVQKVSEPEPEKVQGKNVFVLNPYAVPYKSAYYPYTSRPVYENNKTKFLIARKGDTYKSLATSMQLSEKNLRLYNDVYDDSEPIEDEVIYLEMKSTKSPEEYHTLQKGDTYRYIAQKYGVQLKIIIKRNSGAISSYGIGDRICIGCK
ncbi:MAG: glucosaminidase domain-containing protein [Bacteroidales bacterium]|nr:glucosaminidase domain-containing protein [Bacteroidales bacterium]